MAPAAKTARAKKEPEFRPMNIRMRCEKCGKGFNTYSWENDPICCPCMEAAANAELMARRGTVDC